MVKNHDDEDVETGMKLDAQRIKEANAKIGELQASLDVYRKENEFEYKEGRKTLIFQLGDSSKGWIPGDQHFDKIRKFVKDTKLDKRFNILLFHYAMKTSILE
jgi:hypothetical protein